MNLHRVKGVKNVTCILIANLFTEIYVEHVLSKGEYNHYIYALNSLIVAALVLNFFRTFFQSILFAVICLSVILYFGYQYIYYRMWEPAFVIPVIFMGVYYAILVVLSLVFVWRIIVAGKERDFYVLRFGVCFLIYYLLAFLNFSPEFSILLNPADRDYFFWAFNILNFIFYTVLGKLLIQIRLSGEKYVP